MTIADTEEPVSWLKQNPNRQSYASKPTYNRRISNMPHGQDILPKDRRPVSPPWSNPPTTNDRVSSMIMTPSPTASTASSTPTGTLRKTDGSVHQFIHRLDLDLSPMTIHPRDTEDEEDENEDGDSVLQSPTSIQYASNDLLGRVQSLESELQTAYQHVNHLKAQLAEHDQSTQALVTKHMEEKENEKLRVKQLTELVHTQDLLIQQLQQRQPTTMNTSSSSSSDSSMVQELSRLRADLDTLHFEKRSLETRMAAFLNEELDMSHVSLLSNDDDELFSVAMGYRSSTEQQPQDLLQHMDLRRRSSSIIDADQYSMMTFGNTPSHHRSNSNSENRLCSPMGHIPSNNNNNYTTSPSSRYTNHSTLNLVEERDEEDDAVSRYSSLSSSPATMSFASPTSSMSDPRYSVLKSTQMRTSLSSVSSTHLPAHGSPTNPSTAAAAANAARKAAWARIMIPPATPPPSHPLPPLPPNGGSFSPPADDTLDDDSDMDDSYPDPSHSPRKSVMHPAPLAISTQHPSSPHETGLSSAPPIMSPQRESLEAAMQNKARESAATVHSSGTDETSSRESKQSFWKGVKTKWKRK